MYAGQNIKQVFMTAVERIDTISIQWGTYYRPNIGNCQITLYNQQTGEVLLQQNFDVSQIQEGGLTILKTEQPIENMLGVPLVIDILTDSPIGQAASPLVAYTEEFSNLYINDQPVENAILCFSVDGTDFIKKAHLYFPITISFGLIILILSLILLNRFKKGKTDKVTLFILSFYQYRFLFKQLVKRDFKSKYKRSVLGMFWSVLNPVFMMGIQYFVFSTIFKGDVPYYGVYLLIGVITFNVFSETCNASLVSIVINTGLINKVYVPKYMYVLTKVVMALINFGLSLIPLFLAMIISKIPFTPKMFLAIIPLVCLIVFSIGLGLALSSAMVFFRDTQFLWSLLSLAWMYATPIFYTENIIPENFKFVFKFNPLYHFLTIIRTCILTGVSADPMEYIISIGSAIIMLAIGSFIFKKTQDKFILYL